MLQTGEVLLNRYEITKVIGKGGMSTVYQAKEIGSDRLLAIKDVERSGQAHQQVVVQSLNAEGRMLKQLSNPHLPKIYDIIENENNFMLVMDYIEGESLDKVLIREGAQPMNRVLDWGMQICEVFAYLHSQPTPIIYRDMKPANVMLQPNGKLMMIDFGTARTEKVGVAMQADTICIGTAGFAAPEQFGGIGQSTARTDIFCLGSTLYNMITGHNPCDRPTGILPLDYWNPELANTPLAEIITKCTRNDPNERYQTAMELYEDLHKASMGTYQVAGKKGKTASGSSFRKLEWQTQDGKGIGLLSGSLSTVLQRGRSEMSGQLQRQDGNTNQTTQSNSVIPQTTVSDWQQGPGVAQGETVQERQGEEPVMRKLVMIAILVAIIFVTLTVVLLILRETAAAVVFLVIALLAALASVVLLVLSNRNTQ